MACIKRDLVTQSCIRFFMGIVLFQIISHGMHWVRWARRILCFAYFISFDACHCPNQKYANADDHSNVRFEYLISLESCHYLWSDIPKKRHQRQWQQPLILTWKEIWAWTEMVRFEGWGGLNVWINLDVTPEFSTFETTRKPVNHKTY